MTAYSKFDAEIGGRIKYYCKQRKYLTRHLATMCDFGSDKLNRISNGVQHITAYDLLRLSNALGVSADELIGTDFYEEYASGDPCSPIRNMIQTMSRLNHADRERVCVLARALLDNNNRFR